MQNMIKGPKVLMFEKSGAESSEECSCLVETLENEGFFFFFGKVVGIMALNPY